MPAKEILVKEKQKEPKLLPPAIVKEDKDKKERNAQKEIVSAANPKRFAPQKKEPIKAPDVPKLVTELPFDQRKNHLMQTVEVSADSLLLSFYDNGVVDGDSISVYINGKNIISHNKLLAVASKKTVDISNLGDTIEMLVVADNLGTIPPNTGMVVVHDGDNVYQVNFTADLQTNASIIFKKHKK